MRTSLTSLTPDQRDELHFQALGALVRTESIDGVVAFNEYVLRNKVHAHHRLMLEFLWNCVVDRQNGLALLPRGAAKTTHGTIGFGSWLVANFPDIAIGLMSNTQTQADAFSRAIRNTVDFNPQLVKLFGSLKNTVGAKWTDSEWMRKDAEGLSGT
ncbi:MAG TPA: hypothetical protein VFP22_00525, partial [Candidatus Limnocylindrales bacterium]|nr:hypothetical protein [Candidatus Limnocylindrales bacterium]